MNFETTLNIREDLLATLDSATERMNISRSALVSILLKKYASSNQAGAKAFTRLMYQKSDDNVRFTTKSLYLRKDAYELWCNVRIVFKLSASLLIARAIKLYLEKILNDPASPYNYCSMYVTTTTYHNKCCSFQTIWGIKDIRDLEKQLKT